MKLAQEADLEPLWQLYQATLLIRAHDGQLAMKPGTGILMGHTNQAEGNFQCMVIFEKHCIRSTPPIIIDLPYISHDYHSINLQSHIQYISMIDYYCE